MSGHSALELELANCIIEVLNLEEIRAEDISPEEALFREGLGLDSIDALEIALAISTRYGIQIQSDADENVRIFGSLRTLSSHIEQHRS